MSTPEPMNKIGEAGLTAGDLEVERGMARLGECDYRGAIPHFDAALALGRSASVPCARVLRRGAAAGPQLSSTAKSAGQCSKALSLPAEAAGRRCVTRGQSRRRWNGLICPRAQQ
jgi:hypothetical protein